MVDLTPVIETMEHRWMRAWVNGDMRGLKAITAKNFILLTGSKPPVILDRPSWIEGAAKRYLASSYRFADIYVRGFSGIAIFSATLELKATMDGRDWSGLLFVTDVWRKRRIGGWKLVQRVVSKPDDTPHLAKAIKSLQLWKA
jgi:ketosteroid isomerase-like protein